MYRGTVSSACLRCSSSWLRKGHASGLIDSMAKNVKVNVTFPSPCEAFRGALVSSKQIRGGAEAMHVKKKDSPLLLFHFQAHTTERMLQPSKQTKHIIFRKLVHKSQPTGLCFILFRTPLSLRERNEIRPFLGRLFFFRGSLAAWFKHQLQQQKKTFQLKKRRRIQQKKNEQIGHG